MKLNLSEAKDFTPDHVEAKVPWLQKAGVYLATVVIWCIGGVSVTLLILIGISEFTSPSEFTIVGESLRLASASNGASGAALDMQRVESILEKTKEVRRATRGFWVDLVQFLLGNILLPVLTAILGYVFGTARNSD